MVLPSASSAKLLSIWSPHIVALPRANGSIAYSINNRNQFRLLTIAVLLIMVVQMPAKGPEFTHSRTAYHFDNLLRQPARATRLMVHFALPKLIGVAPSELVVEEPRLRADGKRTTIRKYRTRDAHGDYISWVTRLLDKATFDELAQLDDESHAVFGYRRMNPKDHRRVYGSAANFEGGLDLLAQHNQVVGPTNAGHFSTFGFRFHAEEELNVMTRMQDNITDVLEDSVAHRVAMLGAGVVKIVRHELGV